MVQHRAVRPWLRKFAAYYYNRAAEWGQEAVICYKHDAFPFGAAVVDIERGQFAGVQPFHWQTDEAVALNSWCYTPGNRYRPAAEILQDLVDIVSKNGNLLLNIGPKADGTIPEQDAAILREMGALLRQNGEAIYGSGVWRLYGEGPTQITEGEFANAIKKNFTAADVRYTVGHGNIYAIALRGTADGVYTFPALARAAKRTSRFMTAIVTGGRSPRCPGRRAELAAHAAGPCRAHARPRRRRPGRFPRAPALTQAADTKNGRGPGPLETGTPARAFLHLPPRRVYPFRLTAPGCAAHGCRCVVFQREIPVHPLVQRGILAKLARCARGVHIVVARRVHRRIFGASPAE